MPEITSKILNELDSIRIKQIPMIAENQLYVSGLNPPTIDEKPGKKPDNRITIPLAKMAVETLTGYAARSGDIQVSWDNIVTPEDESKKPGDDPYIKLRKEIAEANDTDIETSELYEEAITQGVSYELFWVTGAEETDSTVAIPEYKIIPNTEVALVWSRDLKPKLLAMIRYQKFKADGKEVKTADVYYPEFSEFWRKGGVGKSGDWVRDVDGDTKYPYKSVPLAIYPINRKEVSMFQAEKPLITGNDKLLNKSFNEVDRFNAMIALLPGKAGKEFADKLIELKIIDDLGDFEKWPQYLQKDLSGIQEFYAGLSQYSKELFFSSIKIPDFTDKEFANAQSGRAMLFKVIGLEFRASKIDTYFDKGLQDRNRLINDVIGKSESINTDDYKMVIKHKRNLPVDREALFEMALKATGILSKETILRMFPKEIVDDVEKELERLAGEVPEVDLDDLSGDD